MQLGFSRADLMKVNLANVPTMVMVTTVRTYVIQMATRYISLIVEIWTWRGSRRSPYSLEARPTRAFSCAPGMARCAKRNQLGCGGLAGDLEVKVLYTPGKGKC